MRVRLCQRHAIGAGVAWRGGTEVFKEPVQRGLRVRFGILANMCVAVMVARYRKNQLAVKLIWLIKLCFVQPLLAIVVNYVANNIEKRGCAVPVGFFQLFFHRIGDRFLGRRPIHTAYVTYALEYKFSDPLSGL